MPLAMAEPTVLELLRGAKQPRKRYRKQIGAVVNRTDGFYIRYYKDSDGVRVKVTERLCDLSPDVRLIPSLQRWFISSINIERHNILQSHPEVCTGFEEGDEGHEKEGDQMNVGNPTILEKSRCRVIYSRR
jgi:hypothetical protein